MRRARSEVIERIAAVANDAEADCVVVAGDVFERHALHRENTQRTFQALRAFLCPVFMLPGNHDPYTPDALYRTERWRQGCPAGVKVLGRPEPVELDGVTLLPCPLTERPMSDPTARLQREPSPRDTVRVDVANGGVQEFLAGLDYFALGGLARAREGQRPRVVLRHARGHGLQEDKNANAVRRSSIAKLQSSAPSPLARVLRG